MPDQYQSPQGDVTEPPCRGTLSPPEWIELEATATEEGRIRISGSRHRVHVTYGADDHRISSIHTQYARPLTLTRDDRRKAP